MCATPPPGTGTSVATVSNTAGHSEQQAEPGSYHICDNTNLPRHTRAAPNHIMCIAVIMTKSQITVKAINHKYSH